MKLIITGIPNRDRGTELVSLINGSLGPNFKLGFNLRGDDEDKPSPKAIQEDDLRDILHLIQQSPVDFIWNALPRPWFEDEPAPTMRMHINKFKNHIMSDRDIKAFMELELPIPCLRFHDMEDNHITVYPPQLSLSDIDLIDRDELRCMTLQGTKIWYSVY